MEVKLRLQELFLFLKVMSKHLLYPISMVQFLAMTVLLQILKILGSGEYTIMAIFSSFGFVVSMPDYIGYGASVASEHPYEHGNSLGSTSYDMLKATKEFLANEKIKTNNKLFLLGYSEGGYATLALQKHLENKGDLSITHSLPGAGAYNKTEFSKDILSQDIELPHMANYLWVVYTYNRIYKNLRRPWSDYVVSPYAEVLTNINSKDITQINLDEFETNPQKLFMSDFLKNLNDKTDEAFLSALSDNDLLDWNPIAPITFYSWVGRSIRLSIKFNFSSRSIKRKKCRM